MKNVGKVDGTEIVQLYVSPKSETTTLNKIQLEGFKRVELRAGEEKTVTFKVSPQQFTQYKNNEWVIEPESFEFLIGASSTDIRLKSDLDLKGDKKILKNGRSVFFSESL